MAAQLLFYQDVHPVTLDRHKNVSVKPGLSYVFAKNVNAVPLTATEFVKAASAYPIVFAGSEEELVPVVVLGAQRTENLFVGDDGSWQGDYIPAFVRRYPFVFSSDKAGKTFMLHIDESFDGFNREGRGERLFDNEGKQTRYLQDVLTFLQEYQAHFKRTSEYCKRLKALDLLQPMQAQFNLSSGEKRSLSGFMTVNRDKLKSIQNEELQVMFSNDELECTYLHLYSLRHFASMLERMPRTLKKEIATDAGDKARTRSTATSKLSDKSMHGEGAGNEQQH